MKLDSEVIKLFQQWQKDTGACPEFDIETVNFELHNFGDYVFTEKGATPKYSHVPTSCYVIKSGMARGGYNNFKLDTLYHLDLSGLKTPKYIKKGDLLLNTTGKGTAGRVTLFDLQGNYVSDSHITRIYPKDANEDSSVFFLYFLSSYGFKNLEKMAEGNGGQVELNPERIKELKILVPVSRQRFIIQNYIIKFIDYYKEIFDKYRQIISDIREKVESFDKAFLPAIFSAEKDVFIVKNFNDWAEQNGYSLSFEDVAFKIGKIVANSDSDQLVCTKRMGFTPDTSDIGDVPWFTVGDLSKVDGLYINIPITKDKTTMDLIKAKVDARGTGRSEKLIPIKKGDVLVSFKLTVGTTKIYNSDDPAYCNEAIDILTPAGYISVIFGLLLHN
jgi:hypothetical protein